MGDGIDRLMSDGAAWEAACERSRTRALRQVAEDEATFTGITLDLAERGEAVLARTTAGRPHRGWVTAVGRDFVVLHDGSQPPVLLSMGAITSLRPQPGGGRSDAAGGRPAPLDVSLATLLSGLVGQRPRVQVVAGGNPAPMTGELRSVGRDVATLYLDGDQGTAAHVHLPLVAEIVLLDETW